MSHRSLLFCRRRSTDRAASRRPVVALLTASLALLTGCGGEQPAPPPSSVSAAALSAAQLESASAVVPVYSYEVVTTWPHDRGAFTEGMIFLQGILLESTGLNGSSSLRKVELQTGRVLQQVPVSAEFFAEGMTVMNGKVYQLTWQNQKAFVYDLANLKVEQEFSYTGEGWGLTTDGQSLIMSDGTNQIRFLDPMTFKVTRTISCFYQGQPLKQLNELEWVKGEIYANIWQTQSVARIDPATGKIIGMIDFSGLLSARDRDQNTDVLNGIAYDAATDRLFVTGKNWPKLFEVRLKAK